MQKKHQALQELFQVEKNFTLHASPANQYSEKFLLLPKVLDLLVRNTNISVFLISDNQEYSQMISEMVQHALQNSQVQKQIMHILLEINSSQVIKNSKGVRKQLKFIQNLIGEHLQQNQNSIGSSIQSLTVFIQNFEQLSIDSIPIASTLRKKFRFIDSINFVIFSAPNFLTKDQIDYYFGQNILYAYLEPYEKIIKQQILNNLHQQTILIQQKYNFQMLENVQYYLDSILKNQTLSKISANPRNVPVLFYTIPHLNENQLKNNCKLTQYQIFSQFIDQYMITQFEYLLKNNQVIFNKLLQHYTATLQLASFQQQVFIDTRILCQLLSQKMLESQDQKQILTQQDYKTVAQQFQQQKQNDITEIAQYLLIFAPIFTDSQDNIRFYSSDILNFIVSQRIVEDTLSSNILDPSQSFLASFQLSKYSKILQIVGEHVSSLSLEEQQYPKFYDVWFSFVLKSREIKSKDMQRSNQIQKIKCLASNCMSLLASTPHCNLKNKDFSDCAIPNSQLYGRDYSGSNFSSADLQNCDFTKAVIDNCNFENSQMDGIKLGSGIRVIGGHRYRITSVAFSANGNLLAYSGDDKIIKIWSVWDCKEISKLRGHLNPLLSIAFSADSKLLASGSQDAMIKLWSVQNSKLLFTLRSHWSWVCSVAFSANSQLLVSCGADKTVKLWDLSRKQVLVTYKEHLKIVLAVAISPDSKMLASSSGDQTIRLWQVDKNREIESFTSHERNIYAVVFSPDSKLLASGSGDCTVKLWDLSRMSLIYTFQDHNNEVLSVTFSRDCKFLASGSHDQSIRVWEVASKKEVIVLQGHSGGVQSVVFSPNSQMIASGSWDKTVRLWDFSLEAEFTACSGHQSTVNSIVFSPDSKILASGGSDYSVILWDTENMMKITTLKGHKKAVLSLAFSKDCKLLASAGADNIIVIWNVQKNIEIGQLQGHLKQVIQIAFSPDSKQLVSCSSDFSVRLWDVQKQNELYTIKIFKVEIKSLAFSSDSLFLAMGGQNNMILFNLEKKQKEFELCDNRNQKIGLKQLNFSPDCTFLAGASLDLNNNVCIMGMYKRDISILQGHLKEIVLVVFASDSQTLFSGSTDTTIIVWNVMFKTQISVLKGHSAKILSLAFSYEKKMMVSAGADKSIIVYDPNSFKQLFSFNNLAQQVQFENKHFQFSREKELTISNKISQFSCINANFRNCKFNSSVEQQLVQNIVKTQQLYAVTE